LIFRSFHQRRLFFEGTAFFFAAATSLLQPLKQQVDAVLSCSGHAPPVNSDWFVNQALDKHELQQ
tara:strand:+ start:680 stop:874 length:195 start_codon:yes stop_codon:yes gene_type:complete